MSDTVLIALITLVSGLVGSSIGAFVTYKVSKLGVESDRAKLLHTAKQDTYQKVLNVYVDIYTYYTEINIGLKQPEDNIMLDLIKWFNDACSSAKLFAPDEVQKLLKGVEADIEQSTRHRPLGLDTDLHDALVNAMRKDLLSFDDGATN